MPALSRIALGFAILRGLQLAALTVPWLLHKLRRTGATEAERSLVLMISSRSILFGLAIMGLGLTDQRQALGLAIIADGLLQLFDALHALAQRRRGLAVLPASLCVLDALAGVVLVSG